MARWSAAACVLVSSLLLMTHAAVGAAQRQEPSRATDEVLRRLVSEFQAQWFDAWKDAERSRHSLVAQRVTEATDIHCHPGRGLTEWPIDEYGVIGWQIKSDVTEFAVCPIWQHRVGALSIDESRRIDNALGPTRRDSVRAHRGALIAQLDTLSRRPSSSTLVFDQLVRFAVDQQDHALAQQAAQRCRPDGPRCAGLRVYSAAMSTDLANAQRYVSSAMQGRSCTELLLGDLLINDERRRWERASCAERRRLDELAWWLADPLWSDAISHRALLQVQRDALLRVRSAFDRDERFLWRPRQGSDARARMLLRYGWPNYIQWSGPDTDREHSGWLASPKQRVSPDNEPYVSYEYRSPRVALVPALRDIQSLYDAPSHAFTPRVLAKPEPWTTEHVALDFELRSLELAQAAALRRTDSILLTVAAELTPETTGRPLSAVAPVILMLGQDPADTRRAATTSGVVGTSAVLQSMEASRPVMLSVEVPADSVRRAAAARSRFGLRLPTPLSALRPGEVAISDPVLLKPMAAIDVVPTDPDSALARMSGSTALPPVGKLGIYWESYGLALGDTVDVAVWIARTDEPGLLRRVGRAVRIVPGAESPTGVSWREPVSSQTATVISPGPVPIVGRGIALDLAQFPPGEYWVEVAMARPGQEPVRGRRPFRILPPR